MGREITVLYHHKKKAVLDGIEQDVFDTTSAVLRDEKSEIRTAGCINFEIINTGTVTCMLFGSIPLLAGGSYQPAKFDLLPVAKNIKIKFQNDFSSSRSSGDNDFPAPGTLVKG